MKINFSNSLKHNMKRNLLQLLIGVSSIIIGKEKEYEASSMRNVERSRAIDSSLLLASPFPDSIERFVCKNAFRPIHV